MSQMHARDRSSRMMQKAAWKAWPIWRRWGASATLAGAALSASPTEAEQAAVHRLAQQLSKDLMAACPLSDAASQSAFQTCRETLFQGSTLQRSLAPRVLWGRQANDPLTPLKDTRLTQLVPDVLAGLYLPLFMFDGSVSVNWIDTEKLYRIKLGASFRNRMPPGYYPYPFWHDKAKWQAYEHANGLLLWVAPGTQPEIKVAQFSWQDGPLPGVSVQAVQPPPFDGQWLWKDDKGRTQPAVTLFDGLYSESNPHKPALDSRYQELAGSLREAQCLSCHVPSNPNGQKRLVLLQTPAHAAGEIERIIRSVKSQRMPIDDLGVETTLSEPVRQALLAKAEAFERVVQEARRWETQQAASSPR